MERKFLTVSKIAKRAKILYINIDAIDAGKLSIGILDEPKYIVSFGQSITGILVFCSGILVCIELIKVIYIYRLELYQKIEVYSHTNSYNP